MGQAKTRNQPRDFRGDGSDYKTIHDLLNLKYKFHRVLHSRIDADNVKLEMDVKESCEVGEVVHLANLLVKLCLIGLFLELVWFSFWCNC